MSISIIFENTGDSIEFDQVNEDVGEYYVNWINTIGKNQFSFFGNNSRITTLIDQLDSTIVDINGFISSFVDIEFPRYSRAEYISQDVLSALHVSYAKAHKLVYDIKLNCQSDNEKIASTARKAFELFPDTDMSPGLAAALDHFGLLGRYVNFNRDIHALEDALYHFRFSTTDWVETPNIFPKSKLTNDVCNLRLTFNHLGRSQWDKFQIFDDNLKYDDENTYDELLGHIGVHLERPQTIPAPIEYVNWCKKNNREIAGKFLNLGILPDLDTKLNDYRTILYRNTVANNTFSIHLNGKN